MSHYMTALAMRQKNLKPGPKIVLYWLADHHNESSGECFPSLKTLAAECEMDKATVVRHIKALEDMSLIERRQRARENGSQTSTSYILRLTPVAKCNRGGDVVRQGPVAICDPHNLGRYNLEDEPTPLSPKGEDDLFSEENLTQKQEAPDVLFDEFWSLYPPRTGSNPKKAARAKFKTALRRTSWPLLRDAVEAFAESRKGEDPKFTPMASTWLHQERWEDWMHRPVQEARRKMNPDDPFDGIPGHVAQVIRLEIDPEMRDADARAWWARQEAAE